MRLQGTDELAGSFVGNAGQPTRRMEQRRHGSRVAFIGANNSRAIAACVPASHQATWDTAALRALRSTDDAGIDTE